MVATRRGTCAEPPDEGERSAAEQKPEKVILPTSPIQTRSSAKKDGQTGENSTNESKSAVTSRSPLKSDPVISSTQIITRSRHRSGQSDADISEAESTASNMSTRRSHSRQSLGQLTDSTRKLRSHLSALISEPIIESKEDVQLSDTESNCSSVSTTARRNPPGTTPRSVFTRSRKSLFLSEPTSDVSDAETNSSPASGVRSIATRSTRNSNARCPSSLPSEPQKEQTSDAESCSSGFSKRPLARRSSRRITSDLQADEVVSESHKDDASDHETLKKQSPKIHGIKSDTPPSVGQQNVLFSLRRSLRNQPAVKKDVIDSDDEPERSDAVNKVLDVKEAKVEERSVTKGVDLPVEASVALLLQSCETHPEEMVIADQVLPPLEDPMDEECAMEKNVVANDNDANENVQDMQKNANMAESTHIRLFIDCDDGKKSEHSDKEGENNMEVEEGNEQVVVKEKSKKVSSQQLQDVSVDGLLVIDTAPGVDSSKMLFLETDDEFDADEKGKPPRPEDEHDNNMEIREEDNYCNEQVVDKEKSKKVATQEIQDASSDGLFVIDAAPGVDSSKSFFLKPDDYENDDYENDVDEKGEPPRPDDDEEEEEDVNNIVIEEDDDHEQVVDKGKSKKASKQHLQGISEDGLFVIDTAPGVDSSKKYYLEPEEEESDNEADERRETPTSEDDDEDFIDKDEEEDEEETLLNRPKSGFMLSTSIDTGLSLKEMGGLYINFDAAKPNPGPSLLAKMKKGNKKKDELLQKSLITPDFEKKESVPPYTESQHKLKKLRKEERDKSSGRGWFDMKAPELTHELKNDLKALKMRSAMDPKHFYKKNDREGFPKYFQVGTVVDNPLDFYHSRIPKKERKRTIVEELLADSEFRRYNKKKFKEIIAEKAARSEGKKNRKKKKFHT